LQALLSETTAVTLYNSDGTFIQRPNSSIFRQFILVPLMVKRIAGTSAKLPLPRTGLGALNKMCRLYILLLAVCKSACTKVPSFLGCEVVITSPTLGLTHVLREKTAERGLTSRLRKRACRQQPRGGSDSGHNRQSHTRSGVDHDQRAAGTEQIGGQGGLSMVKYLE
jgi:hypothetical protein